MKILLVDDHPVFRSGMAVMLRNLFGAAEIVEIGNQTKLQQEAKHENVPDLVLLDLLFPGFDAQRDFGSLRRALPLTPIVVVSMMADRELIDGLMDAGANGFVSKSVKPEEMSAAFLSVMEGDTVLIYGEGPQIALPVVEAISSLTPRQTDVLRHVARGLTNKEIATYLPIRSVFMFPHCSRRSVCQAVRPQPHLQRRMV